MTGAPPEGTGIRPSPRAVRVLVVDDDANTRRALTMLLELEGFSVDALGDASAALERLRVCNYDVLLSDHVMPGMLGLDLARAATEIRPGLTCFIVSGHPPPVETERLHVTWIAKPIDADALAAALNAIGVVRE